MQFKIGSRVVGGDAPPFIIAEAGVNHNGDLQMALELVRRAHEIGADCIKFQTFRAENLVTQSSPKAKYQLRTTDPKESQYEMLKRLELDFDDFREIKGLCDQLGIVFLSTPYGEEDAEMLHELGVEAFKVASAMLVEHPFLTALAKWGKPIILSSGMATLGEVEASIKALRNVGFHDIALLQCTTNYPTAFSDVHLRVVDTFAREFPVVSGFSDHSLGNYCCIASVALGAKIIEKHFTLDKSLPGPDHACSSDPGEFLDLIKGVRAVYESLGTGEKYPTPSEVENTRGMRRSIVARRPIRRGATIEREDLTFKRPLGGMEPNMLDSVIGRVAATDIETDTQMMSTLLK